MDEQCIKSTLNLIRNAIKDILHKRNSDLLFEELYSSAYSMVFNKHGDRLYNGLKEEIRDHIKTSVLKKILQSLNNNLLEALRYEWNEHQTSMTLIREIFMYMDRTFVLDNDLDNVYISGLIIFRDEIVFHEQIRNHIRDTLLTMIMNERHGEPIDRLLLKNACQMLVTLSINNRWLYEFIFERPFLKQSSSFFAAESHKFLSECTASVYIGRVENRMSEEADRAKLYLDKGTEKLIEEVILTEMIQKHMVRIVETDSGMAFMMRNKKSDDLTLMFKLFYSVTNGTEVIYEMVNRYLREHGSYLVKEQPGTNPIIFIQNLLDLKDLFEQYLQNCFQKMKTFNEMISANFKFFFNLNEKSPEYLSLFIDDNLKKRCKGVSKFNKSN